MEWFLGGEVDQILNLEMFEAGSDNDVEKYYQKNDGSEVIKCDDCSFTPIPSPTFIPNASLKDEKENGLGVVEVIGVTAATMFYTVVGMYAFKQVGSLFPDRPKLNFVTSAFVIIIFFPVSVLQCCFSTLFCCHGFFNENSLDRYPNSDGGAGDY